jgi:O-antigen/teichoic acid export membrane protein
MPGSIHRLLKMPLDMRVSLLTRLLLIALGFLTAIVAARLYGPTAAGQIGLLAAVLAITSVISLGGCQMLALKHLAGEVVERHALFTSYLARVAIGALIVAALLLLIVIPALGERYEAAFGSKLLYLLPIVAMANTFRVFLYEAMRAREAIVSYSVLLLAGPLILLISLLLAPHILRGGSFAWLLVLAEAVGLGLVIALFISNARGLRIVPIKLDDLRMRAGPYYVSTLTIVAIQLDIFLVGTLVSPAELGIYIIASRLAGIVLLPKITAEIGYAPQVSRVFRADGHDAAIAHTHRSTRTYLPLTLLLTVLLVAGGPFILDFLGSEFSRGYPALLILVTANMILAVTGHAGVLLMMVDGEKIQQFIFLTSAMTMLLLIFLLVPRYGINGGAIALLAGATVRGLLSTIAVQKILGTGVSAFHVFVSNGAKRSSHEAD